jgi:four helix bundle protein
MLNGENKSSDLSVRTKMFALRIISLFKALPSTVEAQVIGKQVLRSGTSVGAQYREGMRARSRAEFQSKLEGAIQELEETGYWLELLIESGIIAEDKLKHLHQEQRELTAMMTASVLTAKTKK